MAAPLVLDVEDAKAWTSARRAIDMREVQRLSVGTGEVLGHHHGALLLWGLSDLGPDDAAGLSRHRGVLDLRGVEQLSAGAARGLGAARGYLNLSGLKSLSGPVADALAGHRGVLDLRGLRTLSAEAASALSRYQGVIDLRGLRSLTAEVARLLGQGRQGLELSGLHSIDPACVDALMGCKKLLILEGLRSVDRRTAEALGRYWGPEDGESLGAWLPVEGLREALSAEAAEVLRDRLWPIQDPKSMRGPLSDEVLTVQQAIAAVEAGDESAYRRIARISRREAIALSDAEGDFELFGLRELSEEAAEVLATIGDRVEIDFPPGATAEAISCLYPYLHRSPWMPPVWSSWLADEVLNAMNQD